MLECQGMWLCRIQFALRMISAKCAMQALKINGLKNCQIVRSIFPICPSASIRWNQVWCLVSIAWAPLDSCFSYQSKRNQTILFIYLLYVMQILKFSIFHMVKTQIHACLNISAPNCNIGETCSRIDPGGPSGIIECKGLIIRRRYIVLTLC